MPDNLTLGGLSVASLNGFLVDAMDVSQYAWVSLYIGDSEYTGRLLPQVTFDPSDESSWRPLQMYNLTSLDGGDTSNQGTTAMSVVIGSPVTAPFFRVKMTEYSDGAATGVLQLLNACPSAPQLLTTSVRLAQAKNDFGYTLNDGNGNIAIAAGKTDPTVVSEFPGMLARVLVTETGTTQMTFYDSNTEASGTIIGIIPASAPVNGVPYVFKAPVDIGITASGNADNPGVSVFFAA